MRRLLVWRYLLALFRRDAPTSPEPSESLQRERRTSQVPARSGVSGASTVIATGTKLAGTLTGSTDILVDGELDGGIDISAAIVVGEGGRVKGNLSGRTARVAGKVVGNVSGTELVELLPSGAVEGNLTAARVVIAEGAFFKGQVEMSGDRAGATTSAKTATATESSKK